MAEAETLWTEERIALLKQRWAEGVSSGLIAQELGVFTRNAIMGKANRLGLVGFRRNANGTKVRKPSRMKGDRAAAPRAAATEEAAPDSAAAGIQGGPGVEADEVEAVEVASMAEAIQLQVILKKAVEIPPPRPELDWLPWQPPPPPEDGRVTIMELRQDMCRWPLGEPGGSDFHYCGAEAAKDKPYCVAHGLLAYQAKRDGKRAANGWTPERAFLASVRSMRASVNRRPGRRSRKVAPPASVAAE